MSELTRSERTKKRNEKIRSRYNELYNKKNLRSDYCLQQLEDEFIPLKKTTIWLIVSQTGIYKNM